MAVDSSIPIVVIARFSLSCIIHNIMLPGD